jgi:methyl-accepting chemotaxis protein
MENTKIKKIKDIKVGIKDVKNLKSINARIIQVMLIIAAIPIIILGIYSSIAFKNNSLEEFQNSSQTLGKLVIDEIDTIFDSTEVTIDSIKSNSNNIFDGSVEDNKNIKTQLEILEKSNSSYKLLFFAANNRDQFLYSKDEGIPENFDYSSREWYKKAIDAKGTAVASNVYTDVVTGGSIVTISKAVIKDGNVLGVIGVDLDIESIKVMVDKTTMGNTGKTNIMDSTGVVIAHTNKDFVGKNIFENTDIWTTIVKDKNGGTGAEILGEPYSLSFQTSEKTDWKLVIEMPNSELQESSNGFMMTLIIVCVVVLILSTIIGTIFASGISNNIKIIKEGTLRAAEGDFSKDIEVKSKDELRELSDSFNDMQNKISDLINNVSNTVNEVNDTSINLANMSTEVAASMGEVASTVSEISKGSMESANNLEVVSNEFEDVSNQLNIIDNVTKKISNMANETNNLSKDGIAMIGVVMTKSEETKQSTLEVESVVSQVVSSVNNIGLMNNAIAEITEQTNLLALNAAIEAARAGDAGRGFAVVADEIRSLAEQTARSAKDIDLVIKEVVDKVKIAVEKVKSTTDNVNSQVETVKLAESIFNSILSSVGELNTKVQEVAVGVNEANSKKDGVVEKVQNLSAIGEETAAGTEEVTASCEEVSASTDEFTQYANNLKQLAQDLSEEVSRFKLK